MSEINSSNYALEGTKAETLHELKKLGYNVLPLIYFTVSNWAQRQEEIIQEIKLKFGASKLVIRSSANAEDTAESSMAGAFESVLNIECSPKGITHGVKMVIDSYDDDVTNQVLVQPMVENVAMSGVVMTRVLDDGSPYYVINYDDTSGLTDTVTGGTTINKTVFIYNGVDRNDFDNKQLLDLLELTKNLEHSFKNTPLDIEFAINKEGQVFLLQVRKITTINKWKPEINTEVAKRMSFLKDYMKQIMQSRPNLFGQRTLLGFMPDWNPAEMIGLVPKPLAKSLYRTLITNSTWRLAREQMGYRKMPNVDLMISLFGRVYIDVRNSINSFLPAGLNPVVSEKLVNAYIARLDENPHLHDKIEFDVVHTAYDFDFEDAFESRYPALLKREEFLAYRGLLRKVTNEALANNYDSTLNKAFRDIAHLTSLQTNRCEFENNSFSLADQIKTLLDECIEFGTIPFSILARHGFIAEGILRSAVNNKAITAERLVEFKRSVVTIAGEMSQEFSAVLKGDLAKEVYLEKFGHLRPGSYDILSPNYSQRKDLFDGEITQESHSIIEFKLTAKEKSNINILLAEHGLTSVNATGLFQYAEKAIRGREYGKFVFTRHLSDILEYAAKWGATKGFSREQVVMLSIDDIIEILYAPLRNKVKDYYQEKINKAILDFDVASSFKLSYLIRSVRDVHIVPMQRSLPNFIGNGRIEASIVVLEANMKAEPDITGKIVCIEGADPGYDWIFTRNIVGLITKYGGANSHMAIRSAEYNIPAAIGCGEQPFERVITAKKCLLDCQGQILEPINLN